ncbi:MAG TPA: hypothetical protein VFH54_04155, partial [Mycobacteriales bacterium]|nr:hypothetical protein [Mycobacteriales bacterium]
MPENPLITTLRESRDGKQADLDALLATPTEEKRNLNADESAKFDEVSAEIRALDDRIKELEELDKRRADAAEARKAAGDVEPRARVTDAPIYHRNRVENSYFRDLFLAQQEGDPNAIDRLRRNSKMSADELAKRSDAELRALGNTGAAGGSGGEFAPPLWLIEDFVAYARPGRKF